MFLFVADASRKIDISKNSHQPIQAISQISSVPSQHPNDSILQLVDPKTLNSIPHKSNIFSKTNHIASEVQAKNYYNLQEVLQYPNNQFMNQNIDQIINNQVKSLNHLLNLPSNKRVEKSSTNTETILKESSKDDNEVNALKQKRQNYSKCLFRHP